MKLTTKYTRLYLVLLALSFHSVNASERTTDEMNNIAKNWIIADHKNKQVEIERKSYSSRMIATKQKSLNYKIIKLKPKGWIIVSKDDVAHPVLGYSYESDVDTLLKNDSFQDWMKGIDKEIQLLKESGANNDTDIQLSELLSSDSFEDDVLSTKSATIQEKGPLIERSWGQYSPFNAMTPITDGAHTLVGCVATAWVQIMDYWQWPTRGQGTYSYTLEGRHAASLKGKILSVDFNTTYNWQNMSNNDKAKISYHVGVANNMEYGVYTSGTWPEVDNMRNFFKYNMSQRTFKVRKTSSWWKNKIKDNIDSNKPIFYIGYTSDNQGHAFNVDGYKFELNKPDFYHFNWGYTGAQGWYTMEANENNNMGYTSAQQAIFDISPNTNPTNPTPPTNLNVSDITKTTATLTWLDNSDNETGFKIYDQNNLLVETIDANVKTTTLTGLTPNTEYTYTVKSYNATGESEGISKSFATQENILISKSIITFPSNNSNLNANETITLEWDYHGATQQKVVIYAQLNEAYQSVAYEYLTGKETKYNFTLPSGFTYAYAYVMSYDESENLGYSLVNLYPTLTPTNPTPPTNLNVSSITKTTATLTWVDNSDNETGFKIYDQNNLLVETIDANVTTTTLTGLTPNTEYTYTVKSYNATGESEGISKSFVTQEDILISKSIITFPSNNSNLNANETITLEWDYYGATKQKIVIYTFTHGKWQYLKSNYPTSEATSYAFTVPVGTTRSYIYLYSWNGSQYLGYHSVNLYLKLPIYGPTPPTNLNVSSITKTTAILTWVDNSDNETGFKIYDQNNLLVETIDANVTTTTLTGLTPNTEYTYTVKSYNATGESKAISKSFSTQSDIVISKSIITSPSNNSNQNANETITLEWDYHGATKQKIVIYTFTHGKWQYFESNYPTSEATSYAFTVPVGTTRSYIYLYSWNGSQYLGYHSVNVYLNN